MDRAASDPTIHLGGCVIDSTSTDLDCLSCGRGHQIFTELESWLGPTEEHPAPLAAAINRYGASARAAINPDGLVCWPGLWLLLAIAGEAVGYDNVPDLGEYLGMPPDQAAAVAEALLADRRTSTAAAAGIWLDAATSRRFSTPAPPIPSQSVLDAWASSHTDGMIEKFPLDVSPRTFAIFATALLTKVSWHTPLDADDGRLSLTGGLQAIVQTDAAGLVAVAKPMTDDGVDVVSVIADPGVAQSDVWRAVDEVVDLLNRGGIYHRKIDVPSVERPGGGWMLPRRGHSWTITDETRKFLARTAPRDFERIWTTRLPAWELASGSDLTGAPGVSDVVDVLLAGDSPDAEVVVQQAAKAEYHADGFAAAAVTATVAPTGSAPRFVDRDITHIHVDFDHPYAVTAVARGGIWEGIRLFDAWIDPHTTA